MISVIILGTGNLAAHLIRAFNKAENVELIQVYGRKVPDNELVSGTISYTSDLKDLQDADVYMLAISDDAIAEFSSKLDLPGKLLVHTSGSIAMHELRSNAGKGVFYPVQTFSKEADVDFKQVPVCIEAEHNEDLTLLKALAGAISDHVFIINSRQRKKLHLAAVFINNFVNQLYKIGFDICKANAIPVEILYPLLKETARKAVISDPVEVQTGPARRNDRKTITGHLELLSGDEEKIYKLLTQSIQNTYGKKL